MTTWAFSKACLARKHRDGGATILNEATSQYCVLNPTGGLVLEALRKGLNTDQIADLLQSAYRVTSDQSRRDVDTLLQSLLALGVLTSLEASDVPGS